MRAGILMSRITNDTLAMQAALSQVSSDAFKQPVSIILGIAVLLYMDWKFTLATLFLFPSCIVPHSNLWPPRPPSGAEPAGKRGTNGGNDAGNVRRHSRR
jgi:hypothetical protein